MMQNKPLLRAALRVLMSLENRTAANPVDIDLLRRSALPGEIDLDLDDLARTVACRAMDAKPVHSAAGASQPQSVEDSHAFGMRLANP